MRSAFVASVASLLAACSAAKSMNGCQPGASVACACTNGESGTQVCASDGTLGTCSCDSSTGSGGSGSGGATGSGGAIGNGGTIGSGGASESGGTSAVGGATGGGGAVGSGGTGGQAKPSGQFTVTFDGTITNTYTTCYDCIAQYTATPTSQGHISLSYNFGLEVVAVDARVASGGSGYEVEVSTAESNPSMPAKIQGTYTQTPNWVTVTGSCVNFTQLSLQKGGGMAGTLNCTLKGGTDTTPHTAVVQGSFQGMFAP